MSKKTLLRIGISILLFSQISCQQNPTKKIQGVFIADKESIRSLAEGQMGSSNLFATALMEKIIENAKIEFKIKGDSIKGITFIAGQTTLINAKIENRNDSLIFKNGDQEISIIPNEKGFLYNKKIQMIKSTQEELSPETNQVLTNLNDFTKNLGNWQKGYFVDEFGDKTEGEYLYSVVIGNHETSTIPNSQVYVKCMLLTDKLYFEIYNSSVSMKENFPDSKFGRIKIKFPNGEVKSEEVFFFQNTFSESNDNEKQLIFNHLMNENGELKILLDLSTSNSYMSDKYQFTVQKGNLDSILNKP